MREVLNDLSAPALVNAIEANMYASTPFSYNWPRAEVYTGADLSWCVTDVPFPSCNAVFRARLRPEDVDNTIETLIARGQARSVPLQWWTTQDTQPADLGERLVAHGFKHQGDGAGMAIDLLDMNEKISLPSTFTIKKVQDAATLKIWCHITSVGFGIPAHAEPALLDWFTGFIKLKLPIRFFLGWLEGKPVATSMYLLAEGVAGLYFVAVLPEARRRGIGFAITLKPLQEARETGYRVGILQASKMGEPVYRRMGFKKYSEIGSYIWLDELHKEPDKKQV